MNSIKCFFEEGRTTIVIDNPSVEINTSLKKMFDKNTKDIITLLAPSEDRVAEPEVEPMTMGIRKEPPVVTVTPTAKKLAFDLLQDTKRQVELGIDQTILIFAEALDSPMEKVKKWLSTATMDQKKARYADLRDILKLSTNENDN